MRQTQEQLDSRVLQDQLVYQVLRQIQEQLDTLVLRGLQVLKEIKDLLGLQEILVKEQFELGVTFLADQRLRVILNKYQMELL